MFYKLLWVSLDLRVKTSQESMCSPYHRQLVEQEGNHLLHRERLTSPSPAMPMEAKALRVYQLGHPQAHQSQTRSLCSWPLVVAAEVQLSLRILQEVFFVAPVEVEVVKVHFGLAHSPPEPMPVLGEPRVVLEAQAPAPALLLRRTVITVISSAIR